MQDMEIMVLRASVLSEPMALRPSRSSHSGAVVEIGALQPARFHHLPAKLFTCLCLCVPIEKTEI